MTDDTKAPAVASGTKTPIFGPNDGALPPEEWIGGEAGRAEAIKHGADSYGGDDLTKGTAS